MASVGFLCHILMSLNSKLWKRCQQTMRSENFYSTRLHRAKSEWSSEELFSISITVNNSPHRYLNWAVWGSAHHHCVTVLCSHSHPWHNFIFLCLSLQNGEARPTSPAASIPACYLASYSSMIRWSALPLQAWLMVIMFAFTEQIPDL